MKVVIVFALMLLVQQVHADKDESVKVIKTYMPFTTPLDPAKIVTTPDMDLSYGLAGTLVEWGTNKQIVSGVAERWDFSDEKVVRFTLRENAKWSDGSILTSEDVKNSLERGLAVHPGDLSSLNDILDHITCPDERTAVFHLKVKAAESNILEKLTEANYGIVKVAAKNALDLSKTTGPFYVVRQSKKEITLKRNEHWHHFTRDMAESIEIKQPPKEDVDQQTILLKDNWPNLSQASSLMPKNILEEYQSAEFQLWKRPTDRIFLFQLSRRLHNQEGLGLFKFLRDHLKKETVVKGFSGNEIATQIFPKGFQLNIPNYKPKTGNSKIPESLKHRPLEILISPSRVSAQLKENIKAAIQDAVGTEPKFISVPLQDVPKHYKTGDFDFYAGTVGLADPDPDGVMSFYFENDFSIVPSINEDFVDQLRDARKQKDPDVKIAIMRKMIRDALDHGNVLPLFNMSTVGIARPNIDLSQVPLTDESVTLSRVRFR